MNTLTKLLVTAPLLTSTLSGCAVLEMTGELAMGAISVVGETALFITDTATFGAVSSLTGLDDESWATTPSQAASTYVAAASSYSTASNMSSSSYSATALAGLNTLSSSGNISGGGNGESRLSASSNTANNYDCDAREQELMAKMQRIAAQSPDSICLIARQTAPLMDEMAEFYSNCRILDPTGELQRTARENARNMRETARSVCTN